jgi:hypothetical protein
MFGGDVSKGFEFTCAGRLMLVGAFDGLEQEPSAYLSAIRSYEEAYRREYPVGPKVSQMERQDRGHDASWDDPAGEWFQRIDQRLRDAGAAAVKAVHAVTVDLVTPDYDAAWAYRIINSAFDRKRLPVAGELACDSDWEMLSLLREGAVALVGQPMRRAA